MRLERKILLPGGRLPWSYGVKAGAASALAARSDELLEEIRSSPIPLELKSDDTAGRISGYGSVFGVLDSYREIVAKGAFRKSLAAIKAEGNKLPMLWQHRSGEPMGVWDELAEDDRGLKIAGGVVMESASAVERLAFVKAGAVKGLSIGYYVLEDSYNEKDRIRTLKELELVEVSVVTFAANREALLDPIKAKLRAGQKLTITEFERRIRDEFNLSKADARAIASQGYKAWLDRRDAGATDTATDLKSALAGMRDDLSKPLWT